jgi:hypothetical protein
MDVYGFQIETEEEQTLHLCIILAQLVVHGRKPQQLQR